MKTPFLVKTLFLLALSVTSACYSVEFFPVDNYPNLRRNDVGRVRLFYSRPPGTYQRLGILVFKQFNGDVRAVEFTDFVRREIRARGAEAGWIQYRRIRTHAGFEARSMSQRQDRAGGRTPYHSQSLRSHVGVVRVMLLNFLQDGS